MPQGIKIIDHLAHFWVVCLINSQDNWLISSVQAMGNGLIRIRQTFLHAGQENNDICLFHGNISLVAHLIHKGLINHINPTGINDTEFTA